MIDFGSSVNDFAVESMVNLGDASNIQSNLSLGLNYGLEKNLILFLMGKKYQMNRGGFMVSLAKF